MISTLLALSLAAANLPPRGTAVPPDRVQAVLDRAAAELDRLRCYDAAAAALEQAELGLATKQRGAGARWLAARRALAACRPAYSAP